MRKRFGVFCVFLGICCLLACGGFVIYNHMEDSSAENASRDLLQDVRETIADHTQEESSREESVSAESVPVEEEAVQSGEEPAAQETTTTQKTKYDCMGVLSIPVLGLELPVLTDWSHEKLKVAPCRYYGSCHEANFVIAAHNYRSQFGKLSKLKPKDLVFFTDVAGEVHCYEVVLMETLPGDATREMITSGFDLSLYTCTSGGSNRVTARCSAVKN